MIGKSIIPGSEILGNAGLISDYMRQSHIAEEFEIEEKEVDGWLEEFKRAKDVVFGKNASESFRRSVRHVLKDSLARGLNNEEAIDDLVIQICYRAADFGYLLDLEGKKLSDYSE